MVKIFSARACRYLVHPSAFYWQRKANLRPRSGLSMGPIQFTCQCVMNRPCNFFLHKWCANLPDELKHQLHQHPLMLCKEIYEPGRKFHCRSCIGHFKGFRFQCVNLECEGGYCLDIKCASLTSSIMHEIHEHPLLLKKDCQTEGCAACHRRSLIASFGCETCHFSLHYKCALLPPTFRHRYDDHPFILNYRHIEDGPDEYICEFCEGEIDPKWWFYHCTDCDQSACAECILKDGKYFEKSVWPNFKDECLLLWRQRQFKRIKVGQGHVPLA
ncbi:protein VACUOLELESS GAMETOPHYTES-like isoform X1 [Actinidia eriantha]|uniref:protein VACUOLELESS GAMETOPHYTES-like isoform X1 n=2 Tax=Actinidia eriantha TaxID=165200 RepID=UPI0025891150|nr:protein VACUOLELESS GAMETOPHYTES-like isoform X1 [Actinidia eriantha]